MITASILSTHNLNDTVHFKLTDKGRKLIQEIREKDGLAPYFRDEGDGWKSAPLWDFARVFRPSFGMGFDVAVETEIRLAACR